MLPRQETRTRQGQQPYNWLNQGNIISKCWSAVQAQIMCGVFSCKCKNSCDKQPPPSSFFVIDLPFTVCSASQYHSETTHAIQMPIAFYRDLSVCCYISYVWPDFYKIQLIITKCASLVMNRHISVLRLCKSIFLSWL